MLSFNQFKKVIKKNYARRYWENHRYFIDLNYPIVASVNFMSSKSIAEKELYNTYILIYKDDFSLEDKPTFMNENGYEE